MPSLTPEVRLKRLLSRTSESERYVDLGLQLRRLSVDRCRPIAKGSKLTAADGTTLWAGELTKSFDYPVSAKDARAAAHLTDGAELVDESGERWTLRVEIVLSVGGQWDTLRGEYRTQNGARLAARTPHVVDLVESQVAFARRFAQWLEEYKTRKRQRIRTLLAFGGRRSGKSVVLLLCTIAFLIEVPRFQNRPTVAWLVVVSHPERGELDSYIRQLIPERTREQPAGWWTYTELPFHEFTFVHGVRLLYKTTDADPEALRAGTCDLVAMNEAAKQKFEGYKNALRGTTDSGGIVLGASNKPRTSKGEWVVELCKTSDAKQKSGKVPKAEYLIVDPSLNPAIDEDAADDIAEIVRALRPDEAEEGLLEFVSERAYSPPFDEFAHVAKLPTVGLPDITRLVTQRVVGRAFDYIAGADFQFDPHQVAIVFKILGTVQEPILWALAEFYAPLGDEDDLIDNLEETDRFSAGNVLVVGDASGETQGSDRGGPTSYSFFRKRGYTIVGPKKKQDPRGVAPKNPSVELSMARVIGLLKERRGELWALMFDPDCAALIVSLVKCAAKRRPNGTPYPAGYHAHATDCVRYPTWWLLSNAKQFAAGTVHYSR